MKNLVTTIEILTIALILLVSFNTEANAATKTTVDSTITVLHNIKSGECSWNIAKKYNLTLKELKKLNPQIKSLSLIRAGKTIVIGHEVIKVVVIEKTNRPRVLTLSSFITTSRTSKYKNIKSISKNLNRSQNIPNVFENELVQRKPITTKQIPYTEYKVPDIYFISSTYYKQAGKYIETFNIPAEDYSVSEFVYALIESGKVKYGWGKEFKKAKKDSVFYADCSYFVRIATIYAGYKNPGRTTSSFFSKRSSKKLHKDSVNNLPEAAIIGYTARKKKSGHCFITMNLRDEEGKALFAHLNSSAKTITIVNSDYVKNLFRRHSMRVHTPALAVNSKFVNNSNAISLAMN